MKSTNLNYNDYALINVWVRDYVFSRTKVKIGDEGAIKCNFCL